eukprot:34559_1
MANDSRLGGLAIHSKQPLEPLEDDTKDEEGTIAITTKRIATYARIRPYDPSINESKECTCRVEDSNTIINRVAKKDQITQYIYKFDQVFGTRHDTSHVFNATVLPLLHDKILNGVDCIFTVHGQTGSGKSYTLIGKEGVEDRLGVLPLAIQFLLKQSQKVRKIEISAIHVYGVDPNSIEFYDLVRTYVNQNGKNTKRSRIKNVLGRLNDFYATLNFTVKNSQKILLDDHNYSRVINGLQNASQLRPTFKNNLQSSRGHTVYFCHIALTDGTVVHFIAVDLAGEEPLWTAKTKSEYTKEMQKRNQKMNDVFRETLCIKSGLREMESLLSQLKANSGQEALKTPFYSMTFNHFGITRLLSSFVLSPTAYNAILLTIAASKTNNKDTKSTLAFATQAHLVEKPIQKPMYKYKDKDDIIRKHMQTIEQLKQDMEALQHQLDDRNNLLPSPRALSRQPSILMQQSLRLAEEYKEQMKEEDKWRVNENEGNSAANAYSQCNDDLPAVFKQFDADNNGTIDKIELQHAFKHMGQQKTLDEVQILIAHVDVNDDGVINFDEFAHLWQELPFIRRFQINMDKCLKEMTHTIKDDDILDSNTVPSDKQYIIAINAHVDRLKRLDDLDIPDNLPLHLFSVDHICNTLIQWMCRDIPYKKHLQITHQIFDRRELDGDKIQHLTPEDVKDIVKDKLLQFMSVNTLEIICDYLSKWKDNDAEDLISKPAHDIAYTLYNYPLLRLINRMSIEKVNGLRMIQILRTEGINMIAAETGWEKEEVQQIVLMFLKYNSFTMKQFVYNLENVVSGNSECLPNHTLATIKHTLTHHANIDMIHFYIKNNKNNDQMSLFSDKIVTMVDELINDEEGLIQKTYTFIAECFVWNDDHNVLIDKESIDWFCTMDWVCYNCGNYNLNQYINGAMNEDLHACVLCGITQIDSIVLKIRNHDSFVMVNHIDDEDDDAQRDDIDEAIRNAVKANNIDLMCWDRNDGKECPSMKNLAKHLIIYKRWLNTISKRKDARNVHETADVDIVKFMTNETFQFSRVFMEIGNLLKMKDNELQLLLQMCDDLDLDVNGFLQMPRKAFICSVEESANVKKAIAAKIYRNTKNRLKKETQTLQFGQFLSDSQMNRVNDDYNHILRSHIAPRNTLSIKNLFRFFRHVVHWEDTELDKCVSLERHRKRAKELDMCNQSKCKEWKGIDIDDQKVHTMNTQEDKDIWTLKQHYHQSQLDVIHTHLAHSDWKYMVQQCTDDDNEHDYESKEHTIDDGDGCHNCDSSITITKEDIKDKFVTDPSTISEYGFGVVHEYHQLKPKFSSLHDEIVDNHQCPLEETAFHSLLVKAIQKHKQEQSSDNWDGNILICKSFNPKYQIIRNEWIGIRHILSIVIYTDATTFCTAYRATYRKLKNETTEDEVRNRHREFYYFARFLFEAIQFFGHVVLKIADIYNANHATHKLVSRSKELRLFNKFQRTIRNRREKWDKKADIKKIKALQILILGIQQKLQNNVLLTKECPQFVTDYGISLFNFFCQHQNTTTICIRSFESLPFKDALFMQIGSKQLSIIPLLKLFCNVKEITLNRLDIETMAQNGQYYVNAVLQFIHTRSKHTEYGTYLKKISFKSKTHNDWKQSMSLRTLTKKNRTTFREHQWSIDYEYESEKSHNLVFNNNEIVIADKIQQLKDRAQQLQLEQQNDRNELLKLQHEQVLIEEQRRSKEEEPIKDKEIMLKQRLKINGFLSTLNGCFGLLQDHYAFMDKKEDAINAKIGKSELQQTLKQLKQEALQRRKVLLNEVMSVFGMHYFLEYILQIEDELMHKYATVKTEQESSRLRYAPQTKRNPQSWNVICFEDLWSNQADYLNRFSEWMKKMQAKCEENKIEIRRFIEPKWKPFSKLFYETFYMGNREITDYIRCSFWFNNFDDLYRCFGVIDECAKEYDGLLGYNDRFEADNIAGGYRSLLINVFCPGSKLVCEIQLHHVVFETRYTKSRQLHERAELFECNDHNWAHEYATK